MLTKTLFTLFFIFALIFTATLNLGPYPYSYLVKTIPIWCLAAVAFMDIPGSRGKLTGVGLLFSSAGDIILELEGGRYFVPGLGAFLVAHLFYIAAFIRQPALVRSRLPVLAGIALYGVGMGLLLIPRLGDMLVPVVAYLVIILLMGIAAALGTTNHAWVIVGAALFVLSDSAIAVNRFLTPVPLSGVLIMATYYLAQFFITSGVAKR